MYAASASSLLVPEDRRRRQKCECCFRKRKFRAKTFIRKTQPYNIPQLFFSNPKTAPNSMK